MRPLLCPREVWRLVRVANTRVEQVPCRYCWHGVTAPITEPALKGIRVLDLTRVLAGPFCTMLLGDMGCDVIKVERPGAGDDTRAWGPPFLGTESVYFLGLNRNKRSITVDLKSAEGKEVLRDLVKISDVLIENFLPGTLDKIGLGYQDMQRLHPGLVYASISGFGPTGPMARRPGYDVVVSGMYGLMSITGPEDGPPCKPGVALTDVATGLMAQSGILAALLARQRTGRGQKVDVSLMETQLASLVNIAANVLNQDHNEATEPRRWGTAHESIVPYQAFESQDGTSMVVGAGNDEAFRKLVTALGDPVELRCEQFNTNRGRVDHREELLSILQGIFKTRTRSEWLALIEPLGIPVGPVRTVRESFDDEQARHRGMVQEVQHPTVGTVRVPGSPLKLSANPTRTTSPPPLLGQHTNEVLLKVLGYSQERVDALRSAGVV